MAAILTPEEDATTRDEFDTALRKRVENIHARKQREQREIIDLVKIAILELISEGKMK